jgi:ribonuclease P protein component
MQQRFRLTESRRFSQIHAEGRNAANRLLVIRVLPNDLEWSRFGFVVSKRVGNAVTRNRVKRRLREAIRQTRVKGGWDAVFIARRGAEKADFQQLKRATNNLLRRTNLFLTDSTTD